MLLAIIVVSSVAAPLIAPYDPLHAQDGAENLAPSAQHWFGTDMLGRDVFSRVVWGGRQTLLVGMLALIFTVAPGTLLGVLAGYAGRWLHTLITTLVNALLAIPTLVIAMVILTTAGRGTIQVALAAGLAAMPTFAILCRAATVQIRGAEYVAAAHTLGARPTHILRQHILPNIRPSLIGAATVTLAWSILNSAALNYLGFGGDPGIPEWGAMLAEARQAFRLSPWAALAPGVAITLTLLAINLLGQADDPAR